MKYLCLFALLLACTGMKVSAQVVECDTMTLTHVNAGIKFQATTLSAPDSSIVIPMVNNTTTNFAYPQIKLINTTPLPPGMSLHDANWQVFASAWNIGDTAPAYTNYFVNTIIPDNYTVTFKLYATNFAPLTIDSCVFVNTLNINLKPVGTASITNVAASEHTVVFYPNPAADHINICSTTDVAQLEICSVTGTIVMTASITKQATSIDISSLAPGIYFIREQGKSGGKKLVKI